MRQNIKVLVKIREKSHFCTTRSGITSPGGIILICSKTIKDTIAIFQNNVNLSLLQYLKQDLKSDKI